MSCGFSLVRYVWQRHLSGSPARAAGVCFPAHAASEETCQGQKTCRKGKHSDDRNARPKAKHGNVDGAGMSDATEGRRGGGGGASPAVLLGINIAPMGAAREGPLCHQQGPQ